MGFGDFLWETTKTVAKATVVGATAGVLVAATGGVGAVVIGAGVMGEGILIKKAAKESDSEFFGKVGDFVQDVGIDTLTGGVGGVLKDSSKVGKTVADVFKTAEKAEKKLNQFKVSPPPGLTPDNIYHDWHKSKGRDYDKHCIVCRKEIVDKERNYHSKPIIGNFRLNKVLQITQALYYAKYKKPLFRDEMKAYEHGGIVNFIYRSFNNLYQEDITDNSKSLEREQKEFIKKVFYYLKDNYSDKELRDLAHRDLAWIKA
ncbi:hypothetical protein C1645_838282 [Glomus cerebriforme]|uniref:Antitoxin SocA-like Panacea domain-containing protein n=1 Tax=Glomus cerebriforme TaxID=658196 RepID=A0A397SD66_9GLOM|nr:hypothetical protein C1645_838282 [Glomus cerebriforme]